MNRGRGRKSHNDNLLLDQKKRRIKKESDIEEEEKGEAMRPLQKYHKYKENNEGHNKKKDKEKKFEISIIDVTEVWYKNIIDI